jgi:hypothetical protein
MWHNWSIAQVVRGGELLGLGTRCLLHVNPGDEQDCQKQIMYGRGRNQLTHRACEVALKRWLLAGLRIDIAEPFPRSTHRDIDARTLADDTISDDTIEAEFESLRFLLPDAE